MSRASAAEVSVIIPAYNAERTIATTVRSVLDQTFKDLEVLVIDDGSTDGTAAVVERFGTPVSCIRTMNRGVAAARNLGIERAKGRRIAFLDADDVWMPRKLEQQLEAMEQRPDAGLCFTGFVRTDAELRPLETVRGSSYPDYGEALLLYSTIANICTLLVTAETARALGGFDPAFSQCADWDFALRASQQTNFATVGEALLQYRMSGESMSRDIQRLERETFAVLDKFYSMPDASKYRSLKRRAYSNHWMILAGSYLHAHSPGDALRCLANGLRARPANVRRPLGLPARWLLRSLGRLPGATVRRAS
jgi:glycosyltransferase involved in cell wall biosynthesis